MHIEFSRLILHNFMSFGHADIRFNDDGFIRVSGINDNPLDNAGSNGSGKSSLWEAIVWAITGETIRGTKHVVNMFGDDGCYVEVEFYIDKTRYQIIRSKDHQIRKTSIQFLINGEDVSGKGLRDSEKILQQHLPDLTASLLGSVIILGQGLPQKFTNNTPSGRKEVLETLSKSDFMIEDLKSRVTARKTSLQEEKRAFDNNLIELNSKKSFIEKQSEQSAALIDTLDKSEITAELNKVKEDNYIIVDELDALQYKQDEVTKKYQDALETRSNVVVEELRELKEEETKYLTIETPHRQKISELYALRSAAQKQLSQMQKIKDVCPTCGQKLPDVHKPDTTAVEEEIDGYSYEIDSVDNYLHEQQLMYATVTSNIKSKYLEQKSSLDHEMNSLSTELNNIKSKISMYTPTVNANLKKINELEVKLAQIDTLLEQHNKIIRDNNESLIEIGSNIMYNIEQRDLTQSRLDIVSKFETALKRDFRGYLLSTVIDYIQQRAKYYSQIIFDTDNVDFCLDGNNIDISYMNKAYENLSGGEKQKIDLIIQFSIRDMLSQQLGFTSNILVLDEVFDGLDALGCNKVIDMIASLSDIKNIFIVTHRKDLSIPSDQELVVVKSSVGISEIRQ